MLELKEIFMSIQTSIERFISIINKIFIIYGEYKISYEVYSCIDRPWLDLYYSMNEEILFNKRSGAYFIKHTSYHERFTIRLC